MEQVLPPSLLSATRNGKLIPVVGAGVSMSLKDEAGERLFPSWSELLSNAADEIRRCGNADIANGVRATLALGDVQLSAGYVRRGLQGGLWTQFFRRQFEEPLARVSQESLILPRAIWRLSSRIVTLNYDKVLRKSCPDSNSLIELDNANVSGLADFKRGTLSSPVVWHFHGRTDNIATLIFTGGSYDKLYRESNSEYIAALEIFRSICRDEHLFFVGCSLDDADLLNEMAREHGLFEGNIGPHFVTVHRNDFEAVSKKIGALPFQVLIFEDFGSPLVNLIEKVASSSQEKVKTEIIEKEQVLESSSQKATTDDCFIALLSASPLDAEQQHSPLLRELRKIPCSIRHYSLTLENLDSLDGYRYIIIVSNVVKNKIVIENTCLCSDRASFSELENAIRNTCTCALFYFVDRLPDSMAVADLQLPTMILQQPDAKQLDGLVFQIFKKCNLEYYSKAIVCNASQFKVSPLSGRVKGNNISHNKTKLPDTIDPRSVIHFVGRSEDLEQICRKLLSLWQDGGVLTVKGSGGIGKTTIVKKIAIALAERGYFEGSISFVDCEAIPDCQQFKYKVAAAFNLEQADDIRKYLADHHDQQLRLIILDNFETLLYLDDKDDIKKLLMVISDYATIVITSRERLNIEGEVVHELRQLTTDEAVELFLQGLDFRLIAAEDIKFLRQEVIETLLDNNPLAIKLITRNMPKGKSLKALKEELESDLFSKISDTELEVFDDSSDLNISRRKSIYGSILYSYKLLNYSEQRAFELLSLFPDGIELETFKKLTHKQSSHKASSHNQMDHPMITDKVIKALENKSIIESSSGHIKLQSIVGKFADWQLIRRENQTAFYRNAFSYNFLLLRGLYELFRHDERRALEIFNSQQANLLKCLTYCERADVDSEAFCEFLEIMRLFSIETSTLGGLIRELSCRSFAFAQDIKFYIEMTLLQCQYFDGDFDNAFSKVKDAAKLDDIITSDYVRYSGINIAMNIYLMEGEALASAKYDQKHRLIPYKGYPQTLLTLGEYHKELANACEQDFFTLEMLANMNLVSAETIDHYLLHLYDTAHLERMQVSYTRAKLVPLQHKDVEPLVVVNPYTRGLKSLMLAFTEENVDNANSLYKTAVEQLAHIKYYYVEALLFYAAFLRKHNFTTFQSIYSEGIGLSHKHHFRYLQYRFEELLSPTDIPYDHHNYHLPSNEDFSEYARFLVNQLVEGNGRNKRR